MQELTLSVLDQSISVAGSTEDAAIRDTLSLAQHCEALGYHRFWCSEHHNLPTIIGSAPEILMAAIAARTSRIRIGSAGVMLPHYAALKVAEQFRVLEALAPGRIDLGVGRAPGSDMRTARELNPQADGAAENFPQQIRDLQAWTSLPAHRGIGAAIGAKAETLWNRSGWRSASVSAPCPPIEWPKMPTRSARAAKLANTSARSSCVNQLSIFHRRDHGARAASR